MQQNFMQLGWLDFSQEQQNRMMKILSALAEKGAMDEIGIGVPRDAFSDLLFPGMSTLQTRAKYLVMYPWIFQEAEKQRGIKSEKEMAKWVNALEIRLCECLLKNCEDQGGIIGKNARAQGGEVLRKPMELYWTGALTYGIVTEPKLTRSKCWQWLYEEAKARHRQKAALELSKDAEDSGCDSDDQNRSVPLWYKSLPAPENWVENIQMALTHDEAQYLYDRITKAEGSKNTLMAYLLRFFCEARVDGFSELPEDLEVLWEYLQNRPEFMAQTSLYQKFQRAMAFRWLVEGPQRMYRLMLMGGKDAEMDSDFDAWWQQDFSGFPLGAVLQTAGVSGNGIHGGCVRFLEGILQAVRDQNLPRFRELIIQREEKLKGKSRAKIGKENKQVAEYRPLDYRYRVARNILNDILKGLDS